MTALWRLPADLSGLGSPALSCDKKFQPRKPQHHAAVGTGSGGEEQGKSDVEEAVRVVRQQASIAVDC